jgi:hypothetical protein
VQEQFYLWGEAKSAVYRDRPRTLNELKTAITAYIRKISRADLQKVFANRIKRVQTCIDARGHLFQQLLLVHSDFPNALYLIKNVSSHFRSDALWLTAFHYADALLLMGISFCLILSNLRPLFSGKHLVRETRSGYNLSVPFCVLKHAEFSLF